MRTALLSSLVLILANASPSAQLVFEPPEPLAFDFPFSPLLTAVVAGDVTGDGLPDLVTRDGLAGDLLVFANAAGQSFDAMSVLPMDTSFGDFVLADVDGDGLADLVGATSTGFAWTSAVALLSHGDGTFGDPIAVAPGAIGTASVRVAEVTGDGIPDLLTYSPSFVGVPGAALRVGLGDGSFGAEQVLATTSSKYVVVGDVDGDGFDDILGNNSYGTQSWIARGAPGGPGPGTPAPTMDGGFALQLADVDLDGALDLLTRTWSSAGAGVSGLRLGDGTGAFGPLTSLGLQGRARELADLDLDGDVDLVESRFADDELVLHVNAGDGTFTPDLVLTFPDLSGFTDGTGSYDFDLDGRRDLVLGWQDTAGSGFGLAYARNHTYFEAEQIVRVGNALPGSAGHSILLADGSFAPGAEFTLGLHVIAPGSPGWLVLGLSRVDLPLKGGVLVPAPDVVVALPPAGIEGLSLTGSIHPNAPSGLQVWLQTWFADVGTQAFAATPGLEVTLP